MTAQQLKAIKALAERFNSSLDYVNVNHAPFDLPKGWVSAIIFKPEDGKPAHQCDKIKIVAGVSPEGNVHTQGENNGRSYHSKARHIECPDNDSGIRLASLGWLSLGWPNGAKQNIPKHRLGLTQGVTMYKIKAMWASGKIETVDETDSRDDATYLVNEYRLAFGTAAMSVWVEQAKRKGKP